MTRHPQVPVPGTDFETDASIVNLLAYFNQRGLTTLYSCQGNEAPKKLSTQGEALLNKKWWRRQQAQSDKIRRWQDEWMVCYGYVMFADLSTLPVCIRAFEDLIHEIGDTDMLANMARGSLVPQVSTDQRDYWIYEFWLRDGQYRDDVKKFESQHGRIPTRQEASEIRMKLGWVYTCRIPARQLLALDKAASLLLVGARRDALAIHS